MGGFTRSIFLYWNHFCYWQVCIQILLKNFNSYIINFSCVKQNAYSHYWSMCISCTNTKAQPWLSLTNVCATMWAVVPSFTLQSYLDKNRDIWLTKTSPCLRYLHFSDGIYSGRHVLNKLTNLCKSIFYTNLRYSSL